MKFKALEDFRHGYTTFEEGNSYDSEKQSLTEDDLRNFHGNGWAEIEGWDPPPPRQVRGARLKPDNAAHVTSDTSEG